MKADLVCPICDRQDAVRCRDDPRFYFQGRLAAICFHGHGGRGALRFDAETGSLLSQAPPLQIFERLYHEASAETARGLGGKFLAEYCGIFVVGREAINKVRPPVPTEADYWRAAKQDSVLTAAPLYRDDRLVGLQIKIVAQRSVGETTSWVRTLGAEGGGIYIANTRIQPTVVVVFEGIWDAVHAAWDACQAGEPHRYAFVGVSATTSPEVLLRTLNRFFPGVPVLILTDQDAAGIAARKRFAKVGTLAVLRGAATAKDYRDADEATRWNFLLEAMETALNGPQPGEETGLQEVARHALENAMRGVAQGLPLILAWRFAQRCAGICAEPRHLKSLFALRARLEDGQVVAEGQHEFSAILGHPLMRELRQTHPKLASIIEGGVTESPWSPAWRPPQFLDDGHHWTELSASDRDHLTRTRGWEPWTGLDPGPPLPTDLTEFQQRMEAAFAHSLLPGQLSGSVGGQLAVLALAMANSAYAAEEKWSRQRSTGFVPGLWVFGAPHSGKGTFAKLVALATSGLMRTYGNQKFGGEAWPWLTESVLHCPVVYKDEVELQFDAAHRGDLKAFLGGEALQLRKKFGHDETIYPRPVLITSNKMTLPASDEALLQRIVLINLEPAPTSGFQARDDSYRAFYDWLEHGPGSQCLYRLGIAFYRDFRLQAGNHATCWTRSGLFDEAVGFVAARLGLDPDAIMAPLCTRRLEPDRSQFAWYQALRDLVKGLDGWSGQQEMSLLQALGLSQSDSDLRKFRRWRESMEQAGQQGAITIDGVTFTLCPPGPSSSRMVLVQKDQPHKPGR